MNKISRHAKILLQLFLTFLLSMVIILGATIYQRYAGSRLQPVFRYISMNEEATAKTYVWLSRIQDMPLDYSEIANLMGNFDLELVLTPTGEQGIYTQDVSRASYSDCERQAQLGLENAYRKVLQARLSMAGYEGTCSEEELDQLMQETYGLSVSEYLAQCNIPLLPELEDLEEVYCGEVFYE